jgi:hypothetical protein
MSAILQALVQDIRTDVLMTLDPRVMSKKEATALILLTGVVQGHDRTPGESCRMEFLVAWGVSN